MACGRGGWVLVPVSEPVGWAALAEGCTVAVTAGCLAVCAANRAPGSDLGNQTNKSTRSPAASVPCHRHPQPSQRRRRYPSDTTDPEWTLLEALLPPPACTHAAGGRPEAHPRREVVDAIRYLVHNGCVWRALPADFPPWRTVYGFFARWAADGTLDHVHDTLRDQVRVDAGRQPQPSAAIIDSQSVRAADTVAKASRGFDAGKKVNGRKRHIAVDTLGLLLAIVVT